MSDQLLHSAEKLFPGLSYALDSLHVKPVIQAYRQRQDASLVVESCSISDVRCEPEGECTILYRMKISHKLSKQEWEEFYLGKVLKKGESFPVSLKQSICSENLGTFFVPFPHDPVLQWLPEAYDSAEMTPKMKRFFSESGYTVKNIGITTLAYVPEMRATFLYAIDLKKKGANEKKRVEWIAKTNVSKNPERVHANYFALWHAASGLIAMPKPCGFLLSPKLTFQERISGVRLGALVDSPNIDLLMKESAETIAKFHGLRVPLTNARDVKQELKALNRWSNMLVNLRPDLADRMALLKNQISCEIEKRFCARALVHADFHHTNILVDGTKIQLIDMDEVAYGDPALDIGRFLSSLRIPSLRAFGHFDGLKKARDLFLHSYSTNFPIDEKSVRLFEAASLFISAASTFRMQRRNWENEILLLLEEAEIAFGLSVKFPKLSPPSSQNLNSPMLLSRQESVMWAKKEEYVKTLIAPYFYSKTNQEIIRVKFLTEKTESGYTTISYKATLADKQKIYFKLFIHPNKMGRLTYRHMNFLHERVKGSRSCFQVAQPVAYLSEIPAFVLETKQGTAIPSLIGTADEETIAELCGKALSSFHRLKLSNEDKNSNSSGSYVLRHFPLYKIKFCDGKLHLDFPLKKYIGDPQEDFERFCENIRRISKKGPDPERFIAIMKAFYNKR